MFFKMVVYISLYEYVNIKYIFFVIFKYDVLKKKVFYFCYCLFRGMLLYILVLVYLIL